MLIGICGKAGSGKDTVADLLVGRHGFAKVALADPLKRICREVFQFTDEQLWGPSEKRNAGDVRFPREHSCTKRGFFNASCDCCGVMEDLWSTLPCYLTPRHALQQLGTEWGRRCSPNVWVDFALRVSKRLLADAAGGRAHDYDKYRKWNYHPRTGLFDRAGNDDQASHGDRIDGVVISDVRFPNEVAALRKAGGKIWKTTHGEGLKGSAGGHSSESYIDELEVDAIFSAELELEDLPKAVEIFLKEVDKEPYALADNKKAQMQGHLTRSR